MFARHRFSSSPAVTAMACTEHTPRGVLPKAPVALGRALKPRYLSKLRRDSVGADFQSVRKLTNYVCAAPPESRLSVFSNVS